MRYSLAQIRSHNLKIYHSRKQRHAKQTLPLKFKLKDYIYISSFLLVFWTINGGMEKVIYTERVRAYEPLLSPAPRVTPIPAVTVNSLSPINPTPAPRQDTAPKRTEKTEILRYIVEKFGDDASEAITMIRKCENSKFDPKADNWNKNGTWDAGVMMINQVHGYSIDDMKNWKKNIDAAYKIYKDSGNSFYQWSCAGVINQKSYKDNL